MSQPPFLSASYVEETRFGFWFLRSHTWQHHVLRVAIDDLRQLFDSPLPAAPVLLDAGCGQGFDEGASVHEADLS